MQLQLHQAQVWLDVLGCPNVDHTLSSFTTQSDFLNMFTKNSTTLKH